MKKAFVPPTLEEVRAYIIESGCWTVDAEFFMRYFTTGNWRDGKGQKVKIWKLKVQSWHQHNIEMGRPNRKCRRCGKYGEYQGQDDTGQKYWLCADHKPQFKTVLPHELTANALKSIPDGTINISDERNRQMKELKK